MTPEAPVQVDLLGPTQLRAGGEPLATGGPKLRAIVALLGLARGRVVSVDDLLDNVWGEDLPGAARNTLQYHVGVLRKALATQQAAHHLTTRDPGYALDATSDVSAFLARSAEAGRFRAVGDHEAAARSLAEGLGLWRGEPLADLRDFGFAAARAVSLAGQRLACLESWADAELACGRADSLVLPLQDLVTEHPTRERMWEQLMLALYRTGRQEAALSAYRAARLALDRELGINPSDRLVALQRAILNQDPRLAAGRASRPAPARRVTQTVLAPSEVRCAGPTLLGPSGQRVELSDGPVLIGRSGDCDLVLIDSQTSRHHAQVSPAGGGFVVEDLGSTNGTTVNGRAVDDELVRLRNGDRIELGHSVVRFLAGASRPGRTARETASPESSACR
jgi:DNA-binding SARP family transcriptional activator